MSSQAYLDNVEQITGLIPRQFVALAQERGLDQPSVKAEKSSSGSRTTTTWGGGMPWRSSM
jgi:hypothetical protein